MIQINPLKSYIDGGVRAALTTPPSASLVFDLPGKAIWVKGVKLKGTDHTYIFNHDNYITLTNTPDKNNPESEDIKIGINTSALKNAIDTTYGVVSTTANGLAPKFTSGNKLAATAATTYYFLGWAGTTLKWHQAPFRNIRINSETTDCLGVNNTDPLIISSGDGVAVTWDSTNKKIIITNTKPDINHNTDTKVAQSVTTQNKNYAIILKGNDSDEGSITTVNFSTYLKFNPSTKQLTINGSKVITATDIYAGSNAGLVPAATSAQQKYYLRGDGTWVNIATEMAAVNTWRPIKVGNTDALGSGSNTGTLSFIAGTGITLSWDATNKRIIITNSSPDVNHNTDETVRQVPKTDNVNRPLMMINGSISAGEQINTSMFSTGIYANASTKMITANGFIKASSSNSYVLLGGGDHKLESNLSVSSANTATKASYLPTKYDGGDKPNPQYYFNQDIGVRVAMTRYANIGGTTAWFDTLWINGYAGNDVPNMVALTTIRNGSPRAFLSTQSNRSTTYGTYYEIISSYNIGNQSVKYATSAGNADTVDGYHATCGNNKPWGTIPVITTNGWMEIGKHLEFHYDNTTGSDYSTVLGCTGNYGNIVCLPSASGTLALISQIPNVTDYYWANIKVSTSSSTSTSPTFSTCYTSNWFRSTGQTGWYNESYGGGIHMIDSTWVRIYNDKKFYVNNSEHDAIHSAGGVYVAGMIHSYANYLKSTCNGVYVQIGPQNSSHAHYETDASVSHWFNKRVEVNGHVNPYNNNSFTSGTSDKTWSNVYSYLGNFAGSVTITYNSYPGLTIHNNTTSGEASMYIKNNTAGWALGVNPWGVGAGVFAIGQYLGTGGSNWVFKIDNNGYCFTRSYLNLGAGNEKNASNPPYVWGINGSDNYLRTYATSSLSVGKAANADYATCAPAAANWGGTGSTTKIKVKINSATSWMLSFVVTLYQDYKATKIMISGYNYGSNYWYQPEAVLLGDSNGATSISVYFGYDSAYNLWVGFDGGSYTGVSISDVTNGYTQISSLKGLFTISNVSSLTTLQKTITATNLVYHADYSRYVYCTSGKYLNFQWSGQSGQPTWLFGSNDGTNVYVWNPSNFSVKYATSASNADTVDGLHYSSFLRKDTNDSTPYQYNFTKVDDHAIRVGTVRGTAVGSQTGEYIHLYERVAIGSPSGWGSRPAPSYGLATYGGAWLATDTGNVGIGTTGPVTKLDVRGTDRVSMSMDTANAYRFSTGFKGTLYLGHATHGSGSGVNDGYTDGITFGVNGAAYAGIIVQNSGSYGSRILFTTTNDYSYNKARMILDAQGKLGILTMSPSYTLDVNGTIRSTNRIYANEWIEFPAYTGLYWPNGNGAYLHANNNTSYGSLTIRGSRNGYSGIQFGTSTTYMTVMDSGTHKGIYSEGWGNWILYFNQDNKRLGLRTSSLTGYAVTCNGDFYCRSGWLRTEGSTGWYNESYGGGWYMTDTTYIRVYGSKRVYNNNTSQYAFYTAGGITALGHMWSSSSAQSWLDGQRSETAALNIAASSNTGAYWPWFRQTLTAASKWISVGTLNTSLYFIGSATSRTDNSYDYGFVMNFSNGTFSSSGSIYAPHFYENSDIRYKKILRNLLINSNTIATLPLFDFEWIENNTIGTGTSAQAVQQILPNIVSGTDKLTLDYGVLGTIAGITACKELVTQKSEIEQLKEKVKQLEDKLRKYENTL